MASEKTPVLILGGGVAGLAAAVELDRRGVPSLVVEKTGRLGGRAADFCCKATSVCARCGACRMGDLLREALGRPNIAFLGRALAVGARARDRGWEVDLAPQPAGEAGAGEPVEALAARRTLEAGAVILAVGHQPFAAGRKSRFGHGRVPGVISAGELERQLRDGGLPAGAQRLAFIQCVGSRDETLGRNYCSRVCCGFALRLARLACFLEPERQVTFFHMDVQDYGRAWRDELAAMRADFEFVRAIPGEVRAGANGPEAIYAGPDQQPLTREFDRVVLSTGLEPPLAAAALAELFGLARDADGFLGLGGGGVESGAAGVYLAGTASGPRSINESIDHAALAAALAAAHLRGESLEAAHA